MNDEHRAEEKESSATDAKEEPTPLALAKQRDHEIIKASVLGIAGNMLLVVFKLIIGFVSNSIAIILDGVNNATDALSSIVTIIGTKLAGRKPDKKHPFGYGRVEYLTSCVIAAIILAAGIVSLRESVIKIIHPGTPSYDTLTIVIIVVAIIAKIGLGFMFKHYGDKTKSEALVASGVDSNYDAVLSFGTLIVAFAQNFFDLNIDGIVGIVISLVVCKAGIDVLRDALAPIIGTAEDKKSVEEIVAYIRTFPEVRDVNDVILDNFGPNMIIGSVHIKVPEDMRAGQIGELTRKISKGLKERMGIVMTVGVYADNTTSEFKPMQQYLETLIESENDILGVHAFYVDRDTKTCYFDLVLEISVDDLETVDRIYKAMSERFPDFKFDIQADFDYSE